MSDELSGTSAIESVDKKLEELDTFLKEVDERRKALAEKRKALGISPEQVKQLLSTIPAAHRKAAVEQAIEEFGLELDQEFMNFKDNAKSLATPVKNAPKSMKKSLKMFNRKKFSV